MNPPKPVEVILRILAVKRLYGLSYEPTLAHPALGGKDAFPKSKPTGIIGEARVPQVFEGLAARPAVGNLPGYQQEEGKWVKWVPIYTFITKVTIKSLISEHNTGYVAVVRATGSIMVRRDTN